MSSKNKERARVKERYEAKTEKQRKHIVDKAKALAYEEIYMRCKGFGL